MTLYTLTFLLACTLIGAFAARAMAFVNADNWLFQIYGTFAVGCAVAALWSWQKRQGVEP